MQHLNQRRKKNQYLRRKGVIVQLYHQVKGLPCQPSSLGSIPRTHRKVEGQLSANLREWGEGGKGGGQRRRGREREREREGAVSDKGDLQKLEAAAAQGWLSSLLLSPTLTLSQLLSSMPGEHRTSELLPSPPRSALKTSPMPRMG